MGINQIDEKKNTDAKGRIKKTNQKKQKYQKIIIEPKIATEPGRRLPDPQRRLSHFRIRSFSEKKTRTTRSLTYTPRHTHLGGLDGKKKFTSANLKASWSGGPTSTFTTSQSFQWGLGIFEDWHYPSSIRLLSRAALLDHSNCGVTKFGGHADTNFTSNLTRSMCVFYAVLFGSILVTLSCIFWNCIAGENHSFITKLRAVLCWYTRGEIEGTKHQNSSRLFSLCLAGAISFRYVWNVFWIHKGYIGFGFSVLSFWLLPLVSLWGDWLPSQAHNPPPSGVGGATTKVINYSSPKLKLR